MELPVRSQEIPAEDNFPFLFISDEGTCMELLNIKI